MIAPTLAELLEVALRDDRAEIHVSMPGEIVSYDAAKQTALVRPMLKRVVFTEDGEQVHEELPPVANVPVVWPGCAGLTVHGVLEPGDTGDMVFSSWSHNEWQATGRASAPGDLKTHGLGGAKFYPGLRHSKNAAPDADNSIGKPGGLRLHFGSAAIRAGAGGDFVALAQATEARLSALEAFAASHVHTSAAPDSPTTSSVPPFVPVATPVKAANLKADP